MYLSAMELRFENGMPYVNISYKKLFLFAFLVIFGSLSFSFSLMSNQIIDVRLLIELCL